MGHALLQRKLLLSDWATIGTYLYFRTVQPDQQQLLLCDTALQQNHRHLPELSRNSIAAAVMPPEHKQEAIDPTATVDIRSSTMDVEKQESTLPSKKEPSSVFKALGWLDRLLALWILLAMIIGILLGNFVPNTGPALEKGKFVGVSIPIGTQPPSGLFRELC